MNAFASIPAAVAISLVCKTGLPGAAFVLPEQLYAAPGLECNVYFESCLDSVRPDVYAYEVACGVGRCENRRWTWTPGKDDAGRDVRLAITAWSDDGIVASVTTSVLVASGVYDGSRAISCALLGDSLTNVRYQDRAMEAVRQAGLTQYSPVGMRSGVSCTPWGVFRKDEAAHDGYGGFTARSFLSQYALSTEEVDSIQEGPEKDQLRRFGVKISEKEKWRASLLKSPLLRLENNQTVVDLPQWFSRINNGVAPGLILIQLGVNDVCVVGADKAAARIEQSVAGMKTLVSCLRTGAPESDIAILTCILGADQDAYGQSYGTTISAMQSHRNLIRLNRRYEQLVSELRCSGDRRVFVLPIAQALDPRYGYLTVREPPFVHAPGRVVKLNNGLHPSLEGGRQIGDAVAAWVLCRYGEGGEGRHGRD